VNTCLSRPVQIAFSGGHSNHYDHDKLVAWRVRPRKWLASAYLARAGQIGLEQTALVRPGSDKKDEHDRSKDENERPPGTKVLDGFATKGTDRASQNTVIRNDARNNSLSAAPASNPLV